MADLSVLENKIGYVFRNKSLLTQALTHSSYANEHNVEDYERLEFLGDAYLDYATAELLFEKYPTKNEGELTKIRASLVKEATLSKIADDLCLMDYALFNECRQTNPIKNSSAVKCDLFEAVFGAILLDTDKNIPFVTKILYPLLAEYLEMDYTDYKSVLLEIFAQNKISYSFSYEGDFDPKHPIYTVNLIVSGKKVATGSAQNKRGAEQDACKKYYHKIFQK